MLGWEMAKKSSPIASRANPARFAIVPEAGGWAVRKAGAARAASVHSTRKQAENAARLLARESAGAYIVIQGKDGRIRSVDTFSLDQSSAEMISAVEKMFVSSEMKRDALFLERHRMSPEARKKWLLAKYAKH
jgi:hypothetical protein